MWQVHHADGDQVLGLQGCSSVQFAALVSVTSLGKFVVILTSDIYLALFFPRILTTRKSLLVPGHLGFCPPLSFVLSIST